MDDFAAAAVRHFDDAERLAAVNRFDNAGHLIGFAAECAVKHKIEALRPSENSPHSHIPTLVEAAKRQLSGHRNHAMWIVLTNPDFFMGWRVNGRYSRDGTVAPATYALWKKHASRAIGAASLRRSS